MGWNRTRKRRRKRCYQDMDTLVGFPDPINKDLDGGRVQDVELMKGDVQTAFSQDPRSFLADTFVPRRQHHRQSMRRELPRNLEPNPPVTPSHHSNGLFGPPPAFPESRLLKSTPTHEGNHERMASAECPVDWGAPNGSERKDL